MRPVLLVVMDGVGLREEKQGNALKLADTPILDRLMSNGYARLEASGPAVGLPEGYTGNSEVGHLHLGAGRKIPQRLQRINNSIDSGELAEKESVKHAFERAEETDQKVHLAGIVSDGGIHGHIEHLKALIDIGSEYDVEIEIHCFTDGRDVAPKSAEKFIGEIEDYCKNRDAGIATVMGRYYSMDRDNNWDRTEQAYNTMALGEGFQFGRFTEAIQKAYNDGEYDYFIQPSSRADFEGLENEDELIFYNFRADRERQIVEPFLKQDFDRFDNSVRPFFTSMFRYREDFDNPVMFEKQIVENTLGEKIENAGYSQLRVAESQKKPHVTYFFNGQRELEFEHEDRHFVESDKIKAYDEAPEMHADETASIVIEAIENNTHDFILLNFANGDLVGHTGNLDATIRAIETVDRNVGRLVTAVEDTEYEMLVTADHGNCDNMGTEDSPNTSHSLNPVPLIGVNTTEAFEDGELWEVENIIENIMNL